MSAASGHTLLKQLKMCVFCMSVLARAEALSLVLMCMMWICLALTHCLHWLASLLIVA
jgi:hypothetical protein